MLEIVEGGFNTQEINSAFDYDIVSSSEDESLIPRITSSDESESGSENESVSVIPPITGLSTLTIGSTHLNYWMKCTIAKP